jgi:hypothetical protein
MKGTHERKAHIVQMQKRVVGSNGWCETGLYVFTLKGID